MVGIQTSYSPLIPEFSIILVVCLLNNACSWEEKKKSVSDFVLHACYNIKIGPSLRTRRFNSTLGS